MQSNNKSISSEGVETFWFSYHLNHSEKKDGSDPHLNFQEIPPSA